MSNEHLDEAIAKIRRRMALEQVPLPSPTLDDELAGVKASAAARFSAWVDEQTELALAGRRELPTLAEMKARAADELGKAFAAAVVGHIFGPKP